MSNAMTAAAPMFLDTGLEVVSPEGLPRRVFLADASAVAWDGAKAETNGAIYSDRHEVYSYVELRITGRREMRHAGGVWGIKGRMRFTSSDDTGAWLDVIVRRRAV
jgi:hypothetical protein